MNTEGVPYTAWAIFTLTIQENLTAYIDAKKSGEF